MAGGADRRAEDHNGTGGAIDVDPGVGGRRGVGPGGGGERGLDRVDERVEGDVLLALDAAKRGEVEFHDVASSGALNSTCTTARLTSE